MSGEEVIARALAETGTFAPRDVMAAAVLRALREAGLVIAPREPPIKNGTVDTDEREALFDLCRAEDYEGLWRAMIQASEGE